MKSKILIVEDHKVLADGLSVIFNSEQEIDVSGILDNGLDVMPFLEKVNVELVMLDIDLPGRSGLDITKDIRKYHPEVKVLILTFHKEPAYLRNSIQYGAQSFVLKNSSKEEVLDAVKRTLLGEQYISELAQRNLINSFQIPGTFMQVKLTNREVEIMTLVADRYTSTEIAEKLFISAHTVDTHRRNLIAKLKVKNTAGLVRYAVENGYVKKY